MKIPEAPPIELDVYQGEIVISFPGMAGETMRRRLPLERARELGDRLREIVLYVESMKG